MAQKIKNKIKFDKFVELEKKLVDFTDSPLYAYRQKNNYKPVLGEGNLNACAMFIGEAPGETEAKTGRPFVGSAGRILEETLKNIGVNREDVFITSVVQDRPPNNRKPTKKELEVYKPFLKELISLIEPKLIVALGNTPLQLLLEEYNIVLPNPSITAMHGQILKVTKNMKIMPSYHPAYLLYNRSKTPEFQKDFEILKEMYVSL